MIIATSGHVDHGKTSLVKALTGEDTDRLAEEKSRGLTIDLGFAYTTIDDHRLGFVDVPGHARFIHNLLAGISGVSHTLLVVAADDGVMPQTREHVDILWLLNLTSLTVVISKTDMVSPERLQEVEQQVIDLLDARSLSAPIYFVSSLSGEGLQQLSEHLARLSETPLDLPDTSCFRLAVDRVFSLKGQGLVVTGSVFSGETLLELEVWIEPGHHKARVRSLHCQDQPATRAGRGDRCAINLQGDVSSSEISRGSWVTSTPTHPFSDCIDLLVRFLPGHKIKTNMPVHCHSATQHTTGRLVLLAERNSGEYVAQLRSDEPLGNVVGDLFIFRDQAAEVTLGGGTVLNPLAKHPGRRKDSYSHLLLGLADALYLSDSLLRTDDYIVAALANKPDGVTIQHFISVLNRSSIDVPVGVSKINDYLFLEEVVEKTKQSLISYLSNYHTANQMCPGASLQQLSTALKVSAKTLQALASTIPDEVTNKGGFYALPDHHQELQEPEKSFWQKMEPLLAEQPLQPPVLSELAKRIHLPSNAVVKLLKNCAKANLVVSTTPNRWYLPAALSDLRREIIAVAEQHSGQFTVIQFRDHIGLGRNLCIELLEYFDHLGFTRRMGDQRIIQDPTK